ncbi:flagellar biosynthetic protein FliO [Pelagibaculum spongiae]|uniref:flagellar biosynthetic protein FliO n=1 Tax=Pelagibaculum spongiae TaxID=2080658 RepID=UPI0013143A4B|nr:flagellar biosynthetic protein FliO [Pelagibaculum spongiae]
MTSSKQAANQQEILINKNIQIKEAPPELAVTNTSLTDVFSPSNSKFANKPETSLISVVELLGSLLVVVALILLLAWILKRMGMAGPNNGTLKVLSNLPLGQKQQLLVVQAGEHQLLLGVSSGSINLLKEFEKPIVDAQLSTSNQITSNIFSGKIPNKFSNHLARALGKKND